MLVRVMKEIIKRFFQSHLSKPECDGQLCPTVSPNDDKRSDFDVKSVAEGQNIYEAYFASNFKRWL